MLTLTFSGEKKLQVEIRDGRTTIGRDKSNTVVLEDDSVSGFHAEIHKTGNQFFLIDLGSTNGTFINGQRLTSKKSPIKAWDTLRYGKVEAELTDPDKRRPTREFRAIREPQNAPATDIQWQLKAPDGSTIPVTETHSVGRESSNDIRLEGEETSRYHARLELRNEELYIKDLHSTNGTFVNDHKITEARLNDGDKLVFDRDVYFVTGPKTAKDDLSKTRERPVMSDIAATHERAIAGKTDAAPAGATRTMPALAASLKGMSRSVANEEYTLNKAVYTIGHAVSNDIRPADDTVSAYHAKLTRSGSQWTLQDLDSTNGTQVNGKRITSQDLATEDKITFGEAVYEFTDTALQNASKTREIPLQATSAAATGRKTLPAWAYGAIGFSFIVVAGLAALLINNHFHSTLPQTTAKLQAASVWQQNLGGNIISTPAIADINGDGYLDIVVADQQGDIFALDGQAGKHLFIAQVATKVVAPITLAKLTASGLPDVVVSTIGGRVIAFNGAGKILWQSAKNLQLGQIWNKSTLTNLNGDGIPDIIVPTQDSGLVALDGAHGWEIWNTRQLTKGAVVGSPLVYHPSRGGVTDIVSVTNTGQVMAVSSQKGKVWQQWEQQVGAISYASPAYVDLGNGNALIVVATKDDGIFGLDASSGRIVWHRKIVEHFSASPLPIEINGEKDILAVATNGDIHLLKAHFGAEIWNLNLQAPVESTPTLFAAGHDGFPEIIVTDMQGRIHIIGTKMGRQIYTIKPPNADAFIASPLLADVNNDRLLDIVLASHNGLIMTYELNRQVKKGSRIWPQFLGRHL